MSISCRSLRDIAATRIELFREEGMGGESSEFWSREVVKCTERRETSFHSCNLNNLNTWLLELHPNFNFSTDLLAYAQSLKLFNRLVKLNGLTITAWGLTGPLTLRRIIYNGGRFTVVEHRDISDNVNGCVGVNIHSEVDAVVAVFVEGRAVGLDV